MRSADHGENWSSTNPAAVTLNAVHFVTDSRGWAVGNGGVLIRTVDGGDNWLQSSPGLLNLNDVYFVDDAYGWIVGDGGKVLRTTDGGASWTTTTPTTAALRGVFFLDRNTGWAVGKGVILRTVNGGSSWTASAPTTALLQDVWFTDASNGWVVGANGVVLKTINGGGSWASSAPTTSGLNAVCFVDDLTGWAAGLSGSVLRTTNGGTNWTEQRPVATELRSIYFIDDRFGWAAGVGGVLLRSIDGGDTWIVSNPASVALNGVFFASVPAGASVTVSTDPPGRAFTVDGAGYSEPQTFQWEPGSSHTIATTATQDGGAGTRYVFENWSDGGALSHVVTAAPSQSFVARFTTEHQLTVQAGANGTVSPPSAWYTEGAKVQISATPDPGFAFNGWTGSGTGSYTGWANPVTVTMNAPMSESAVFGSEVTVIVQSAPGGRAFIVDGVTYTASTQFTWIPGSAHTVDATSPQDVSADTRYVFSGWSDGGAGSHTVSPVSNTTLTVAFKAQYTLTTASGTGGSVTPAAGWYDAGSIVTITATPDSGYSFQKWSGTGSGSYTGTANPRNITINGPVTQTASFVVGTAPAAPGVLTMLANAPNPFTTETEIRFGLPGASDVRVEMFDVTGRRIFTDTVPGVAAGWQSYRLDTSGTGAVPSGMYFVRISAAGASRTVRILLLR